MASNSQPRVSQKQGKLYASYDLPHRLTCAKVYPVSAPNGSHIILYGYRSGIRILWRGGKPLKKSSGPHLQHKTAPPPKVNGASQGVIVIDSDDEEPQQSTKKHRPEIEEAEFEHVEEEYDPSHPSPPIVQSYDIMLGPEVIDITLPPIPPSSQSHFPEHLPKFFSKKILVAAICSDFSVQLVSVPLIPPSHSAKAQQHIGEQTFSIGGPLQHQEDINCASLTWKPYEAEDEDDEEDHEDESEDEDDMELETDATRLRTRSPKAHTASTDVQRPDWQILVASHSAQYFGMLLIHSVPLIPDKDGGSLPDGSSVSTQPLRDEYLRCPLSLLSFSASHIHSQSPVQLLALDRNGCVKIYDPFTSPAVITSPGSRRQNNDKPSGTWLASFLPGFDTRRLPGSNSDVAHRKRVIDAQWILNSRAIIVLLADGEWGIWCLRNTISRSDSLVIGGAVVQFTMHGFLVSSEDPNNRSNSRNRGLTPATPNTRKSRSADFLTGSSASGYATGGGIRVMLVSDSAAESDERLLMWYNNHVYAITNFKTYWQRNSSSQTNTTTSHGAAFPRVETLELQGERCNGVEQLPGPGFPPTGLPELLLVGEHRLTLITKEAETLRQMPIQALKPITRDIMMDDIDQTLLEREELDLGGVNRMLDTMGGNATEQKPPRRVGFAH
ncbi:MAG: hypothetical protein Q9157_002983 [Trypethelium eluteriae]